MQVKFNVFWRKNLGTLYKDNSIDTVGKEANVDIDLKQVHNIYATFKVGGKTFTDLVEIVDIETGLINIPFKTDVIKLGTNELELVANMKNGSVMPSQTYTYTIDKSLENPNSVEAETNYPILIELLKEVDNSIKKLDTYWEEKEVEIDEKFKVIDESLKEIVDAEAILNNALEDLKDYKDTTTNELNNDLNQYKTNTTRELKEDFNRYSSEATLNLDEELDSKFTTKSEEITKTLNDEIDKVNASLNSKINEVDEIVEEVELSEQVRKEEHEELINELSTYADDINNVKDKFNDFEDRIDTLETKITNNEVVVDLKAKVNEHEARLDALEEGAINNTRIDNLENKINVLEPKVLQNEKDIKNQGVLIDALFDLDETISIEEEGSAISLPQSKEGKIIIDELQGNTLVNYCTNGSEELTLNNEINVQGTNVTLTDTIDNSKVDVVCEGNTLVNLGISENFELTSVNMSGCNFSRVLSAGKSYGYLTIPLDKLNLFKSNGKYKIIANITKNTLVEESGTQRAFQLLSYSYGNSAIESSTQGNYSLAYDCDETGIKECVVTMKDFNNPSYPIDRFVMQFTSSFYAVSGELEGYVIICEYDENTQYPTLPFEGMKSAFELEDNKVEIASGNSDNTSSNTHSIQLSEPLRGLPNGACDKFVKQGGKWYIERNCGIREYQEGDIELSNVITDNVNTVYQLDKSTYEEITDPQVITYLDITHISNNSTIPCNMKVTNSGYNTIIKPSTQYTVAFDTDKSGEVNIGLGGAKTSTTNNVATITTPSALTDDTLRLYGKGIKASNVRLLEGDKTNYIPSFFEGMKSCFEDKEQDNGNYEVEIMSYNENKSNSIQLQLNEPLRAVGDVKDRFVLRDGKLMIERNCGQVIYNGDEEWVKVNNYSSLNGLYSFYQVKTPNNLYEENVNRLNFIVDKLPLKTWISGYHKKLDESFFGTTSVLGIWGISINYTELNEFKQWLQDNPIKITYKLSEPTYEEVPYETQKLILECFENGTLFIDTLIPPTVSITYSANKPVVAKLNQVDNTTNVNTEDIAITQMAVDFLLMSSLGEEMINFKIKGGTNMSAYFASRIIKGALKYEDVINKYPNYKEDIDLILIAEGYSDLIVEL